MSENSDIIKFMHEVDVFSALANPARRRILELLCDAPLPAGEIASEFQVNRPAVSEHLQVLRNAGLVASEVRGRQRYYHLNATALAEVTEWLHPFEKYWRQRFTALQTHLEEEESK
jgi:DNA-binding transcriptional ArsR family regulator